MKRRQVVIGLGCLVFTLAGIAAALSFFSGNRAAEASLRQRLQSRVPAPDTAQVDCSSLQPGAAPLRLLVLGQSNAANHGEAAAARSAAVVIQSAGGCYFARDPLPGGTGRGGSIWPHLPAALRAQGIQAAPRFTLLAVDATSINDWLARGSPVAATLDALLAGFQSHGTMPDLVLLQLGEADARQGTSAAEFRRGLLALAQKLQTAGSRAPLIVARSTVCRSEPSTALRDAVDEAAQANSRVLVGPDTDSLRAAEDRIDGCHFSQTGLSSAAALWAASIRNARAGVVVGWSQARQPPRH